MKGYYTRTLAGIAVVFAALAGAAFLTNSIAADARERHARLREHDKDGAEERVAQREKVERLTKVAEPMHAFSAGWKTSATLSEKDAAERIRTEIEAIAQRQLGLVTDNAITPQPERYLFQGQALRVQRVTLRASGKDLAALLAWLGKVEERYPAALIEGCEFSSNVGGNTGLTLRLVQPVGEPGRRRALLSPTWTEATLLPEAMTAVSWRQYLPGRVKPARAVGFHRNPLQPAVTSDPRALPLVRDERDEVTPQLELALEGRLRSVIRGASPLVVVDGRIFRVGDEIVIGPVRERLLPEAKTKLKRIGDEHLTFQVSGGTLERPLQCDVSYALPSFLKAR